jgi:fucose permease
MPDSPRRARLLLGLCYLAFVSIGLPDGLLGVAWPSVRASFDLGLDALGSLLIVSTAGYVTASFCSGWLLRRVSVGALLALSCVATAASVFGYAGAPWWAFMVAMASLAGLGAGAIDAGLNTFVATHYSARTLNWLHAFYGGGAASGPMLMTSVLAAGLAWQWGYALVGIGQLVLAAGFAATLAYWPRAATGALGSAADAEVVAASHTLRLPAVWLGIAAFFVYTGLEAAAGAWAFSLFVEQRGIAMGAAGAWVSGYWAALAAGRVATGFVLGRASIDSVLRGAITGMTVGAALLSADLGPLVSGVALVAVGGCAGPIFPSLIAATPRRLGTSHTANAVGFQIAAAAIGQALLPALAGILAQRAGLMWVAPALLGGTVVLLGVHTALVVAAGINAAAGAAQKWPATASPL